MQKLRGMAERASRSIVAALTASANSGEGYSRRVSLREDLLGAAAADLGVARDIRIAAHQAEVEKAKTVWQNRRDSTAPERYYRLADVERVLRATPLSEIQREAMQAPVDMDRADLLAARLMESGDATALSTAQLLRDRMEEGNVRRPWLRDNADVQAIAELKAARVYGMMDVPEPTSLDSDPAEAPRVSRPPAPAARGKK